MYNGKGVFLFFALAGVVPVIAGPIRSVTGPDAASIQSAVDAFRTDLGTLNANVAGSFASGRREINWDGVPAAFSAPNNLPANFFNSNSPRGVVFSTPGTGFQVSGSTGDATPVKFDNLNPTYSSTFATFSPQRLFTSLGSNILDINFFVPGSSSPATVFGFGAVFTDVDQANTTSIQFFNTANASLGTFFVPNTVGSQSLSFFGTSGLADRIARVRITSGNTAVGPNDNNTSSDIVVMDDFIYAEPQAVPEPATISLVGAGLIAAMLRFRKRRA